VKLYRVFSYIKLNDPQIIEKLNKSLTKKFPRLKSGDFFTILYGIYRVFTKELINKPENKAFITKIIEEIEKKSTFDSLNLKQFNAFLEVLSSEKFGFFNKDLFIDAILHKQINNYSLILKHKLKENDEKVMNLPYFSNFIKNTTEIQCNCEEIVNFLGFIKEKNVILSANELLNIVYFLVQKAKQIPAKNPKILEISPYFAFSLSKSNLHQIHQENLPFLYKTLEFLSKNPGDEILKRSFGFLMNSIYKFSDFNLCKTLVNLCFLSRNFSEESSQNLKELLIKAIERFVLRNEYHSYEEIEEIREFRDNNDKIKGIPRISSYSFVKDGFNENYKLLIKKHTQIINSLWFLCTFYLQESKSLLENSLIWKEFAISFNNIAIKELFTIDNIQKLEEIRKFMQIHRKFNTEILFENPEFSDIFIKQEEFLLKNFEERKKNLRISLRNHLEKALKIKGKIDNFTIEISQICKGFPLDIIISEKNGYKRIAIVLASIYEERNEGFLNDREAYKEYFRIREFTIKYHFGGEVYFIVKEQQCDSLIEEILQKIQ